MNPNFIEQRYQKIQDLGEGAYGCVTKAFDTKTGSFVAIKSIKIEDDEEGIPSTALREISVLKELKHPNIVKLLDVHYIEEKKKLYLTFEYIEQDLKKYIDSHNVSAADVKSVLHQICKGLQFCHQRRVFHRDLKPQNILITKEGTVKLADFGLSRTFSYPINTLTHEVETLWYRAPEILLGEKHYSLSVDIWSVGCVFAEILEKKVLFQGDSEIGQLFKIFQILGTPSSDKKITLTPYFKPVFPKFKGQNLSNIVKNAESKGLDLLSQILKIQPEERLTIKQILSHEYFNQE